MPHTQFKTRYYVYKSKKPGKNILLFAPHSDERSAGYFLKRLVRYYKVNCGTLVVCPLPILPAWRRNKRYYIKDVNRAFSNNPKLLTPIDIIANHVKIWIKKYKIDVLLNLHEGWLKFKDDWNELGQCIMLDDPSLMTLCRRVTKRINKRILPANKFLVAYKPMKTTLTFYGFTAGVKSIGIEISRNLSMYRKIIYQKIVVEEFLKEYGIKLYRGR